MPAKQVKSFKIGDRGYKHRTHRSRRAMKGLGNPYRRKSRVIYKKRIEELELKET